MESFTNVESRALLLLATAVADFRTVESMANELKIHPYTLTLALQSLESRSIARRPLGPSEEEQNWWRLVNRGLTKGEKLRQVKTTISRG